MEQVILLTSIFRAIVIAGTINKNKAVYLAGLNKGRSLL